MLTVDLVSLRRRGGVVELVPLNAAREAQARALAEAGLVAARAHEGLPRVALAEALELAMAPADDANATERRLALACKRLLLDACDFAVPDAEEPEALRATLFAAAAAARAEGRFAREELMEVAARERGVTVDELERRLFADLPEAHLVQRLDLVDADELVRRLALGQLQAVLLRATRVEVTVDATPTQLRALLRTAKLHQLLFDVEPVDKGARLVFEGPLSLFSSVTRYGLKLALLVPAIRACRAWRIEATVRLRHRGSVERFVAEGVGEAPLEQEQELPPLVARLSRELQEGDFGFQVELAGEVLRLPGTGALVPDLVLTDVNSGEQVFVEVLGFWSRPAVWRRVELVERGLPFTLVIGLSDRLRVSEEALPDTATGALLVFKGALPAARVVDRARRLCAR